MPIKAFILRHPAWFMLVPAGITVAFCVFGFALYFHTRNPRLLSGDERAYAAEAFSAAELADRAAEQFKDTAFRDQEFAIADTRIAVFRGQAHSKEGYRALTVLEYYMSAIKELPNVDRQCSILRAAPDPAKYQSMGSDAMTIDTTPFLQCIGRRIQIESTARSCRNEALSYISPTLRPPSDVCVYRWENPGTDRSGR